MKNMRSPTAGSSCDKCKKEPVSDQRKSDSSVVPCQSLKVVSFDPVHSGRGLASGLVGAGEQQRRGSVHAGKRHGDVSVQQCGELKEGAMALQLCRAEGSHWTQAGPEVDIGE